MGPDRFPMQQIASGAAKMDYETEKVAVAYVAGSVSADSLRYAGRVLDRFTRLLAGIVVDGVSVGTAT